MRMVGLLTRGWSSPFAAVLCCLFQERGLAVDFVVRERKGFRFIRQKLAELGPGGVLRKATSRLRGATSPLGSWLDLAEESRVDLRNYLPAGVDIITVDDINSVETARRVSRPCPVVLIQAGVGILRGPILDLPGAVILNAHMGLLPAYRGMNVLEWSLFHGHPLGITIHRIDRGIDTGPILLRKYFVPKRGDTIQGLRNQAMHLSARAMMEAVEGLAAGSLQWEPQPPGAGRQYYRMHEALKGLLDAWLAGEG